MNNYSAPTGYTGTFEWLQTGSSSNSRTNASTGAVQPLACNGELDTDDPYDTSNPTNDSPSTQLSVGYSDRQESDSFVMTLMFQPKLSNGIFVPVASVSWKFGYNATSTDGGNTWTLASTTAAGTLTAAGTTTFPAWNGNLSSCHY